MRKNILATILTAMLFCFSQTAVSQSIIMGSTPLVSNIGDYDVVFFYDPGGSPGEQGANQDPNGYFDRNLRDTMTLRTNVSGTVLYVLFEEFAMGDGDTLWIFDGPNVNAPLYGVYNLVQSPGEIYASDRMMTFVFHSDNEDIPGLQAGWLAKVSPYSNTPESLNWPQQWEPQTLTTCNAWFYDSGGPDNNIASVYTNSSTTAPCYCEFISPVSTHIKCEFTQFSVNGVMEIWDGQYNDPDKRLIGQFCSSTLDNSTGNKPPVLFSTGNTLSFVYRGAAGDMSKPGWKARITCVAELFTPPGDGESPCPEVKNYVDPIYEDLFDETNKTIQWDCNIPIVLLKANVTATGQYTNDYWVQKLEPYNEENMLFGYDAGNNIGASTDDSWQPGVQLPFTFKFFGKNYTTVYPGTNGLISMSPQSGGCTFSYNQPQTAPVYTSIPYVYKNCIYGVYEDIDCRYFTNKNDGLGMGAVKAGVVGSPPCRAFVFNYLNVGLYGLTNNSTGSQYANYNTYQMVFYEGTNIIDIYIKHRKCCATTNSHGEGIIGLQNSTSSQILLAPGRGMSSWNADNEHWRFTPITPLDEQGELTWYVDSIDDAHFYSHDKLITVSKPNKAVTRYISVYSFTNSAGQDTVMRDTTTILVHVPEVHLSSSTGNNFICPNDPATLSVSFTGYPDITPESYLWSNGDTTATVVVNPLESTTYTLTVTFNNGCDNKDTVRVKVTDLELPEISGTEAVCQGYPATLTATHATSNQFQWSNGQSGPTITVTPQVTTLYTVSATMQGNCTVIDTFTVTVLPLPTPSFMASPTEIFVENNIGTVTCTNLSPAGYHLLWNFGDIFSNVNEVEDVEEVTHDYTHSGYYTITLTATDSVGCVDSIKTRVSVEVPYFFYIPNAFTPDGDGINETFAPKGEGVDPEQYSMQIFDRSGMLIYSTRNPYDYWDGRNKWGQMCPDGVYVYIIRLVNLNGDDKEYTGSVTLAR